MERDEAGDGACAQEWIPENYRTFWAVAIPYAERLKATE
jgi:hypothetical protein